MSKIPNSFPVILVISLISLYIFFINKVNIHVINTESRPEEQKEAAKVQVGRLVLGGVKTWKLGKKNLVEKCLDLPSIKSELLPIRQ